MASCIYVTYRRLGAAPTRITPLLKTALVMTVFWAFIIDYRNIIVFYLMIMPYGLLEQLNYIGYRTLPVAAPRALTPG